MARQLGRKRAYKEAWKMIHRLRDWRLCGDPYRINVEKFNPVDIVHLVNRRTARIVIEMIGYHFPEYLASVVGQEVARYQTKRFSEETLTEWLVFASTHCRSAFEIFHALEIFSKNNLSVSEEQAVAFVRLAFTNSDYRNGAQIIFLYKLTDSDLLSDHEILDALYAASLRECDHGSHRLYGIALTRLKKKRGKNRLLFLAVMAKALFNLKMSLDHFDREHLSNDLLEGSQKRLSKKDFSVLATHYQHSLLAESDRLWIEAQSANEYPKTKNRPS